jgi:hypothetical protein
MEDIGIPIMKLSENTSLYPIVGKIETKKLLLAELKTKDNVTVL